MNHWMFWNWFVELVYGQKPVLKSIELLLSTYAQLKKNNALHKQFFLFTHHKRDISHFLVVTPCLVTRCFTPVCNPVVLPRPCRVEVLEPFPRRVYPVCLSPPPVKWEMGNWLFFCVYTFS